MLSSTWRGLKLLSRRLKSSFTSWRSSTILTRLKINQQIQRKSSRTSQRRTRLFRMKRRRLSMTRCGSHEAALARNLDMKMSTLTGTMRNKADFLVTSKRHIDNTHPRTTDKTLANTIRSLILTTTISDARSRSDTKNTQKSTNNFTKPSTNHLSKGQDPFSWLTWFSACWRLTSF